MTSPSPFPAFPASPASDPAAAAGTAPREFIVVADDADISRALTTAVLRQRYDTREVGDVNGLFEILRSPPRAISAIVLDMLMPSASIFQITTFMHDNGLLGLIPLVVVTAIVDPPTKIRCFEAGVADIIEKPYNNEYLLFKIGWTIDRFRRQHASAPSVAATAAHADQLEAVINNVPAAVFVDDPASDAILFANEPFHALPGMAGATAIGQPLSALPLPAKLLSTLAVARGEALAGAGAGPYLVELDGHATAYSVLFRRYNAPVSRLELLLGFIARVSTGAGGAPLGVLHAHHGEGRMHR